MSMRERGSGGGMRDGNTGLGIAIIVVAVVVAVVLLHHSGSTKAVTASTTSSGPTTTIIPTTTTAPGSPTSGASTGGTTTTLPPGVTTTTIAPADIKVLVLNGASFTENLATEFTEKVKNLGYTTLTPNNAAGVVKASQIYVMTNGDAPEGDALAKSLGLTSAAVTTTLTTNAPLSPGTAATGANLVLVVGPDLASKA
jgi:LytR cell envelope-related transcriptional attenuator